MFVKEVRRHCPFFPACRGRVRKDFEWRGYQFPKDTRVIFGLHATNHDPKLWDAPEQFFPERFREWQFDPFTFVPQGGGDRDKGHRCPGDSFSAEITKAAVRFLTEDITFDVPSQDLSLEMTICPPCRGADSSCETSARRRASKHRRCATRWRHSACSGREFLFSTSVESTAHGADRGTMQARNTRWGLVLFAVYLAFYSGFVLLAAFSPETLALLPFAGVNLAIWYGFALIVVALGARTRLWLGLPQRQWRDAGRPAVIYETSWLAIGVFFAFVAVTLALSMYLGRQAKSSAGYFAAHGQIPWFVNGVAFAGDYLSAASFLGICGMIAFYGYDGFLYSIGYLAGWIVALFVVAEPLKRLGKFTFADALDSQVSIARHQAHRRRQHARGEHFLSDSADGRRRRARQAAVGYRRIGLAS